MKYMDKYNMLVRPKHVYSGPPFRTLCTNDQTSFVLNIKKLLY